MGSKWRKAKLALTCLHVPSTLEDSSPSIDFGRRLSDAALLSRPLSPAERSSELSMPMTPIPSSSGLRLQKHCTKSSKRTCAICLTTMKPGQGHAIFTAECSHSFHFHCITSNVKHGNQSCPVCRAKWKEIPFQRPPDLPHESARVNTVNLARDDPWMNVLRRLPRPRPDANRHASSFLHATEHGNRHVSSFFHATEPGVFDDDELVDHQTEISEKGLFNKEDDADADAVGEIDVKTYPEVSAVSRSASHNNFTILIHLKALASRRHNSRAPVDLVTVLDISGSMAGTKLALLKRATGFVIQHLGPSDRLSVIAFSSTARRLFPLRRMTDTGRREALQAVNGLTSNGGTNIAEGLRKGAKVMTDRKWKNPVGSIILLSDGQDTYNISTPSRTHPRRDYQSLLPISIPVHAFGFGADHDAASMHLISEGSGGTFSFIEAESAIQDAFAQCIGGLLTVVVQELQVGLQCVHPRLQLGSIKAGSYKTRMMPDSRFGSIDVGDLYVDEDRDFLVTVDIPVDDASCDDEMSLLKVRCVYRDPITKESVTLEESNELKIQRPKITRDLIVSLEVDRQRNRLQAAEAMAEARAAAEGGDLAGAASILLRCREVLLETASAQAGDQLCITLAAELREMQERMANHRVYEASGRAYVLSGLSSHSWQRATTRGHSTDGARLVQAYQTPSMVDMVTRSQTMFFGSSSPQPSVRPTRSFSGRPLAR